MSTSTVTLGVKNISDTYLIRVVRQPVDESTLLLLTASWDGDPACDEAGGLDGEHGGDDFFIVPLADFEVRSRCSGSVCLSIRCFFERGVSP